MRWSRLHGDMQGVVGTRTPLRPNQTSLVSGKTQAKFLVG